MTRFGSPKGVVLGAQKGPKKGPKGRPKRHQNDIELWGDPPRVRVRACPEAGRAGVGGRRPQQAPPPVGCFAETFKEGTS